ncbi:MAG: YtxH domain-containing protein [Candidatus Eremiobacteraeota bacterium]|nr:YtxH domain-containing protein [Candidatus Eremiobacteraeota bacterium]
MYRVARETSFIAGLFTGALVGASLAMVLAPASGEETRDLLRAKAREASERAADAIDPATP